ncbi:hypothetical protein LCGC14_2008680 [marine sediment metagenome]|uniref:Uncharacterized protein n=1 Tax=marine sediment metagenome TaxID=412755 RepID=A0A0F9HEB0_9ZZZZ
MGRITVVKRLEEDFYTILGDIFKDLEIFWDFLKTNLFILPEGVGKNWQRKLQFFQNRIDILVEKAGILKQCGKCGVQFPATRKHFYLDMKSRDNLCPDCINCHKETKKIGYNRKIAPESIHG